VPAHARLDRDRERDGDPDLDGEPDLDRDRVRDRTLDRDRVPERRSAAPEAGLLRGATARGKRPDEIGFHVSLRVGRQRGARRRLRARFTLGEYHLECVPFSLDAFRREAAPPRALPSRRPLSQRARAVLSLRAASRGGKRTPPRDRVIGLLRASCEGSKTRETLRV